MIGIVTMGAMAGAQLLGSLIHGAMKWAAGRSIEELGSRFWEWVAGERENLEEALMGSIRTIVHREYRTYESKIDTLIRKALEERKIDLERTDPNQRMGDNELLRLVQGAGIPFEQAKQIVEKAKSGFIQAFVRTTGKEKLNGAIQLFTTETQGFRQYISGLKGSANPKAGMDWLKQKHGEIFDMLGNYCAGQEELKKKLDETYTLLIETIPQILESIQKIECTINEIDDNIKAILSLLQDTPRQLASQENMSINHLRQELITFQETMLDIKDGRSVKKKMHTREIGEVVSLMMRADRSMSILGINALGPLHQGREIIINLLNKGGTVRVLLLKKDSASGSAFKNREGFELDGVGRLKAEWEASLAILRDIASKKSGGVLELRFHGEEPRFSIIIVDDNKLHFNSYPPLKGKRGVTGSTEFMTNEGREREDFLAVTTQFEELWEKGAAQAI